MFNIPIMIEVFSEMEIIDEYINLMEQRATFLTAQLGDRLFHQNKDDSDDMEITEDLRESCQYLAETAFLYNLRSSIVITLWSTYESNVIRIAERWKTKNKKFCTIHHRNGKGGFLERATKYYAEEIEISLTETSDDYSQLKTLYLVRNALAHGSGYRESVSRRIWHELQRIERNTKSISTTLNQVGITKEFTRESFIAVRKNLTRLSNLLPML